MEIVEAVVKILSANASLVAAATGGIWETVADRDSRPPFVIVTFVAEMPTYTHQGIVSRSGMVDVKVITQEESFTTAETIKALTEAAIAAPNDYEVQLHQAASIRYVEHDKDVRYNHLGRQYRYLYAEPLGG